MKKILKIMFVSLMLVFIMPISLCLSGCGATTTNQVFGVQFLGDSYASDGTPVFNIDLGVKTFLNYKTFPSTCSGYNPKWKITKQAETDIQENAVRFDFSNGNIIINNDKFEQITVEISVGGYTDSCFVKLKKYPDEIKVDNTSITMLAGGVYPIDLKAKFKDSDDFVSIDDENYKVLVESSNETIISVPDVNRLVVYSTNIFAGSAKVTINVLNAKGEKIDLKTEFQVNIIQNAKSAFLDILNHSGFVENSDEIELSMTNNLTNVNANVYEFQFIMYAISVENTLLNCNNVLISTDKSSIVTVNNQSKKLTIEAYEGLEIKVNIYSDLIDEDGNVLKVSFKIKIVN